MTKFNAIGKRGSWFATVNGELLPCVHKHWFKPNCEYDDPGVEVGAQKWDELIDALRKTGKAILTTDLPGDSEGSFRRSGYIAVYSIENVRIEENCLRFRFLKRLVSLN